MSQATATGRPRRADAQRNYDRILAVARAKVADRGGDIVLEDIARDAEVGIGTLYRHFPTRQTLLEAAFLDEANELRRRADELAQGSAPFESLVSWLRLQMDFGAHGHSMGAAVMNAKHTDGSDIQLACQDMREAGAMLLKQAQADGSVRPGVVMSDILRVIHGIVLVNQQSPDIDEKRVSRMFDLVIAGIRA
jgi:AcrR family transcriptional regulator